MKNFFVWDTLLGTSVRLIPSRKEATNFIRDVCYMCPDQSALSFR